MRRLRSATNIILLLGIAVGLAACGGGSDGAGSPDNSTSAQVVWDQSNWDEKKWQ